MSEKLDFNFGDSFSKDLEKQVTAGFRSSQAGISQSVGKSFEDATKGLGSIFRQVSGEGIKGGIQSSLSVLKSATGLFSSLFGGVKGDAKGLGSAVGGLFSSAPVIGSVVSGLGSLFEGIVSMFGGITDSRQAEIDKAYQEQIDAINATFEKEIEMRSQNIDELNKKLSAFTKALDAGQMTAEDYYQASSGIGEEIQSEELEQARAKKLQEIARDEASKKKAYDEENAKWFPDNKKLSGLQNEINRLKERAHRAQQATTIADVNMARDGALQRVDRPTLFMAGEEGSEIVAVRPLKAGIDSSLSGVAGGNAGSTQVFNISVQGFVGDETALGSKITQMIQSSIRTHGEREHRR